MAKAYSYIRFSTPEQEKGDSLRRQLETTRKLAAKHKLQLDETLSLTDKGVSGFKGKNKKGALGRFFVQIEEGKVPKGSWLIVESLDRISREDPWDAFTTLSQIVNAGITVATTVPEMIISKAESAKNPGLLFIIIGICLRAHEESQMKSHRIARSWAEKRDRQLPATSQCPAWLRLNKETTSWEIIEERAELVREMFRHSVEGHGDGWIARHFNERGITPWGKGKRRGMLWHESYVTKILTGKAVLGEYQPHKMVDGVRTPTGDILPDYFPQIVTDELYYSAMGKRASRFRVGVGPTSKGVSNLFSGSMFCSGCSKYCGTKPPSVVYVNKGEGTREWSYLVCQGARLKGGCDYVAWPHAEFERLFLEAITQIDLSAIFDEEDEQGDELKKRLAELAGKIEDGSKKIDRLEEAILSSNEPPARLVETMIRLNSEQHEWQEEQRKSKAELTRVERSRKDREVNAAALKQMASESKDQEVRVRLREQIRERILRITVTMKKRPVSLASMSPKDAGSLNLYYLRYVEMVTVQFRSGATRTLQLWPTEPTKYMRGLKGQDAREQRWSGFRIIDVSDLGVTGSPERVAEIEKHGLENMRPDPE